jgi:hypothetical protein
MKKFRKELLERILLKELKIREIKLIIVEIEIKIMGKKL